MVLYETAVSESLPLKSVETRDAQCSAQLPPGISIPLTIIIPSGSGDDVTRRQIVENELGFLRNECLARQTLQNQLRSENAQLSENLAVLTDQVRCFMWIIYCLVFTRKKFLPN